MVKYPKINYMGNIMLNFESDYIKGAHPDILKALIETNDEPLSGYGRDKYTSLATDCIRAQCKAPSAEVYYLTGGTQANKTVIATCLKLDEGVIAPATGHVSLHEVGAIEYTGHKVIELPALEGKLDIDKAETYLDTFYKDENNVMMVRPGMIYISHPTEYGTLYTRAELERLSDICERYEMKLFVDGARLGYGLCADGTDVTLADLAELCDVFYIGGTKVGSLCGEAVVFPYGAPERFWSLTKQHGAMVAKGRIFGVQFYTLFKDGLYYEISRNAIERANELKAMLREKGYPLYLNSPTNQQFVILTNSQYEKLSKSVKMSFWERLDGERLVVRFATSFATTKEEIDELAKIL